MPAATRYKKSSTRIHGKRMAYVEHGEGDPIVFIHGNPTSSYLWRNVMPHMEGMGRLIAPDLIGMGDSEKLDGRDPSRYTFVEHRKYLFELFRKLGVRENVTLVVHDWGSVLGFHWAHQNSGAMKGIALMEAIAAPFSSWDDFPEKPRAAFQGLRSKAGEKMILDDNYFIEKILTGSILRKLSDEEMTEYRRPFKDPGEGRRPTLSWPREIPIEGVPEDVDRIVKDYGRWIAACDMPKLFINAEPGAILTGKAREFVRSWENLTEITVKGSHFIQEDSPDDIGRGIAVWLKSLPT